MHTIGNVLPNNGKERVLIITSAPQQELYVSKDGGVTWSRRTDAFEGKLEGAVHCGPNMIQHPSFGTLAVFGQEKGGQKRNYVVRSVDDGRTWDEKIWTNSKDARSVEPALAVWGDGHMIMIAREFNDHYGKGDGRYFYHTQHIYRHKQGFTFDNVDFFTSHTNIRGNIAAGRDCHDTADVIYNPVTERIEVLQSHRWGGGLGFTGNEKASSEDDEISTLNLWSIDPDNLLEGSTSWRFDGTLLSRKGYSRKGGRDGLHPESSIVDLDRNQQHIFLYAGWRRSPCSIFRLSRTLNTDAWRGVPE